MIQAPANAPQYVQELASNVQRAVDSFPQMFISNRPYTVAQLTATLAALFPWKMAIVSNGASNKFVAISNGVAFYYLEGTAV